MDVSCDASAILTCFDFRRRSSIAVLISRQWLVSFSVHGRCSNFAARRRGCRMMAVVMNSDEILLVEKRDANLWQRLQVAHLLRPRWTGNRSPCADAKHGATGVATKWLSIISLSIMQPTNAIAVLICVRSQVSRSCFATAWWYNLFSISPIGLTSE